MAFNGGRRGPNLNMYIQSLNSVDPNAFDLSATDEFTNFDQNIDQFLNTEFHDDDGELYGGASATDEVPPYDPAEEDRVRRLNARAAYRSQLQAKDAAMGGNGKEAFVEEQFQFADFPNSIYPAVPDTSSATSAYPAAVQSNPFPIQPALSPTNTSVSSKPSPSIVIPAKRPSSATAPAPQLADHETQARLAAEEDKRRRNTAASARFRIKKKQREQEVEKTAKEMTDKVNLLESRVKHLEMENEWLRSLIVDKTGNVPTRKGKEGKDKKSAPVEKEESTSASPSTTSTSEEEVVVREEKRRRKDGVGTKA